jgi:type IX secretion system PorP/SprF family membrane protein
MIQISLVRRVITFILFLSTAIGIKAQDPQFSQFYSNPLYLAPSFAGAVDGSRVSAVYRDQWWESKVTFKAFSLSYDHYFSTFNSGVGFIAFRDISGSSHLGSLNLGLQYSYNLTVFNVWHIRP